MIDTLLAETTEVRTKMEEQKPKQLLHLVFGGELSDLQSVEFKDLDNLDIVGIFPDYQSALTAWRGRARGAAARNRPSTTPPCAISSSICIGS